MNNGKRKGKFRDQWRKEEVVGRKNKNKRGKVKEPFLHNMNGYSLSHPSTRVS